MAVTVTPGRTALVESVTTPDSVTSCAWSVVVRPRNRLSRTTTRASDRIESSVRLALLWFTSSGKQAAAAFGGCVITSVVRRQEIVWRRCNMRSLGRHLLKVVRTAVACGLVLVLVGWRADADRVMRAQAINQDPVRLTRLAEKCVSLNGTTLVGMDAKITASTVAPVVSPDAPSTQPL